MLTLDLTRPGSTLSPWREMMRLQDEMNGLFSRYPQPQTAAFPAVNLWTSQESAVITTELPGVELSDLDISVVGDTLTLRGNHNPQQQAEGTTYHRRERGYGRFARTFQLPFRIEPDEVSATLKNGVLTITLPRAQADRPKKIQVQSA